VGGENLTALSQPLTGDDKHQDPTGLEPAIGVAQEHLLCAATVSRPQCPIVRWIQIEETKALDWALHFQRISLDDVRNPLPGLLGAVGIQLDPVAKHMGSACNSLERHSIANTRVDCGRRIIWKAKESANPLGFR
jgi:hypothetical protein